VTKKKFKVKRKKQEEKSNSSDVANIEDDLPIDIENEQYILACVLKFKNLRPIFYDEVDHVDFLIENHKTIAWTILEAMRRDKLVTPEILQIIVADYEGEKKFTGLKYLYELINSQEVEPSTDNFNEHIKKLKTDKTKSVIYYAHVSKLVNMLRDPHSNVDAVTGRVDLARTYIEGRGLLSDRVSMSLSEIDRQYEKTIAQREEGTDFQSIGYKDINQHLTEGLAAKRISIYAGRTGMCKSAFVDNVLLRLGHQGVPSALFSLEMDRISTYDRLISITSGIPLDHLMKNRDKLTEQCREREFRAREKIRSLPIYMFDKPSPTIEVISKQLRYLKEQTGLKVAFIDLFTKIQKPRYLYGKSTADQLTHMLNAMQDLAKNLEMHIGLVVQIGRKAENRKGKRPKLSDLKDSGSFEEIADLVLLLYRESYYLTDENERKIYFQNTHNKDILEILIAKQRQGCQNEIVRMEFKGPQTKVMSLKKK